MAKALSDTLFTDPANQVDFYDHFTNLNVASVWTDTSADAGSAPSLNTAGVSAVTLTTGTTANFDIVLSSTQLYDITADRPLRLKLRARLTEGATNAANAAIGLSSSVAADFLADTTGAPSNNYSGAIFFKTTGTTTWQVESSVGTSQTTTSTSLTAGTSGYQSFMIEITPISSTQAEVVFSHDANGGSNFMQVKDTSGNVVKHTITYTSFSPAAILLTVKNSAGTTVEVLDCDYVTLSQLV